MKAECAARVAAETVGLAIPPNVGSVPTGLAEAEGVQMRRRPDFEDEDQFVLGAVERPHTAIVLHPNEQVLHLRIDAVAGRTHLSDVTPVHADEMDRAVDTDARKLPTGVCEKGREIRGRHLA
ncbi:MAG: hypothetical protein AAF360_05820 [Pseudomonadota bacterium]